MTIRVTILTGKEEVSSYSKIYWKKEMGSKCQGKLEDKRVILDCTRLPAINWATHLRQCSKSTSGKTM